MAMEELALQDSLTKIGSHLVPIGRFARATRLSVKTLRFYDEMGLLRPAAVDPHSGYRYYNWDQLECAERIRLLRSLDLPLEEVRGIIQETDPSVVGALINRHKKRITEQIVRYQRTLKALEDLDPSGSPYQPVLKNFPAQYLLVLRVRSEMKHIEQARAKAFAEVAAFAKRQRIKLLGPPTSFAVECNNTELDVPWHTEDHDVLDESRLTLNDVGWQVEAPIAVPEPFLVRDTAPTRVVSVLHLGPYEPLHLAHQAAISWAREQGLTFTDSGRELFLLGPAERSDPGEFRTEIQYPVQ
jgi:DNA-binding transcriptional MerR regulator